MPAIGFAFVALILGPQLGSISGAVFRGLFEAPFPFNLISLGVFAFWLVVAGVVVFGVLRLILNLGFPRGWWEAALRLTRFAAANGLVYGHEESVAYPGSVFQVGTRRVAERRLSSAAGRHTEIGNYRYVVESSGENKTVTVHRWGYIAVGLDRNMPHMLLDSRANDCSVFGIRSSNLPIQFDRDQVLSLEGDFDRHFTLYAPQEYERDALYVFTPDLMALLIDEAGGFDVEIVDDTMFIYSATPFDLLSPATYERMRAIVATVGAKTLHQTARYADERVGDRLRNEVAPPGRRLRRRTPWLAIVLGVAITAWWIWDTFFSSLF
ncbi:hypothetical protein [Naasia aerilata]|uniref:DUF3137 domain-containing protein n=1 Tax=Naasia aerilata TaxID=1162966 RepID=A0ABN6XU99_9MICO|nr:hypothetical protein [Naasia aerilata]BDZ47220.1 hypothetical protein GCM10025866_31290 [Naasia aerilata]